MALKSETWELQRDELPLLPLQNTPHFPALQTSHYPSRARHPDAIS